MQPGTVVSRGATGYVLADAATAATARVAGLVVGDVAVLPAESFAPQVEAVVDLTLLQWEAALGTPGGLSPGRIYYLRNTGGLSLNPPTIDGEFIVPVGLALTPTELHLRINLSILL